MAFLLICGLGVPQAFAAKGSFTAAGGSQLSGLKCRSRVQNVDLEAGDVYTMATEGFPGKDYSGKRCSSWTFGRANDLNR